MTDSRNAPTEAEDLPVVPDWRYKGEDPGGVHGSGVERDSAPDSFQPGVRVGDYVLADRLGAGATGTVFRGQRHDGSTQVAIKILDPAIVGRKDALQRFRKEAALLAEVNSHHITRLIDVCEADGCHFIVTELVEGDTVAALLKMRRCMAERTAVQIAAEVAEGLVEIADLKIIHRDIKPDNILLAINGSDGTSEFTAKLTDFGLARQTEQSQSMAMTRENAVLGTPLYMSPEQFSDAANLDVRTDVYSLGATLFHMLTGEPPFPSDDILQLAEMHRHLPAPDARSQNPDVSDGLSAVVSKCLQKRADLRYQSAAELLSDLHRLQRGEVTSIAVHPLIPACDRRRIQTFRFEWDLVSTPAELWPYVSNTERLNRAIGLPPIRYTTTMNQDDCVETFANVRIAGMAMRWREHVFEWIEERRMGILREFESGPLKWFTSVVEFVPTVEGRTRLIHSLQAEGNGVFGRAFVKLKFGFQSRRSLSRVYERIDGVLAETHGANPLVDAFETTRALRTAQQQRLNSLVSVVQQEGVSREALLAISEYAAAAPEQEAGRIRPLALAQKLNLSFEHVMEILLRGAKAGMFELVWDVICPSCRIATQSYDLLRMVSDHEHCQSCNVRFDVDLTKQVEAVFRVHPQLRKVDTGKYCIGGPAHSPHVVAQTRLLAGETVSLGLALADGNYRIRGPQLAQSLDFLVHSQHHDDRVTTQTPLRTDLRHHLCQASDWERTDLRLGGLQQVVTIHNDFKQEIVVRIERTAPVTDALTAAGIMAIPLFRKLFPTEGLAKSQLAAMTTVTLLQTAAPDMDTLQQKFGESRARQLLQRHLQQLSDQCSRFGGKWIKIVDQGALMAFVNPDDALECAEATAATVPQEAGAPAWDSLCAVLKGEVTVSMICGQLDYMGKIVDDLRILLKTAQPGQVAVRDEFRPH